ncbi:hypothetical protein ULMS_09360 [Patiriisocius marinistellae]|uniref:Uncharacterized protein n=1 Tax=Patiriisocius marinistellae TaxID=2494560 RepID=A0A5J4FW15_9FLAO|nr:hypothetical protein [Patiriisocius marinistellae]GEQ85428.1 hypothetical protein ULMS_09360 [Patiriisocius marinistellae]
MTNFSKADLRVLSLIQERNAVISTDIHFNEIGSGSSNMLMVCIVGASIRGTNMENFRWKIEIQLLRFLNEPINWKQ